MKRVPAEEHVILEWPSYPTLKEQQLLRDLRREKQARKKVERQTPEQMIHSFQSVFCGGRYRSWICSGVKKVTKTTLQLPRSGRV